MKKETMFSRTSSHGDHCTSNHTNQMVFPFKDTKNPRQYNNRNHVVVTTKLGPEKKLWRKSWQWGVIFKSEQKEKWMQM